MTTYKEVQHFMNVNGFTDLNGHNLLEYNKPGLFQRVLLKSSNSKHNKWESTLKKI